MSTVLIACDRRISLRDLADSYDPEFALHDTLRCVLDEIRKTHTVPDNAIITIRVEFAEET